MTQKVHAILAVIFSGFFLLLDQLLKWIARASLDAEFGWRWFGWEYFENSGIALSLPFPNWLIVALTPLIVFLFFLVLLRHGRVRTPFFVWGVIFIITGASSNYIDRLLFEVTIDYLRIATAIINLADLMILFGALLVLKDGARKKPERI